MNATAPTEAYALPDALDAEMALLGAILIANEALHTVSGFLKAEHFVEPLHGRIYDLCTVAIGEGRRVTAITLAPLLPPDLRVGDYTPAGYLGHLTVAATSISNVPDYGRVIVETALRREGMELAGALGLSMSDQASGGSIRDHLADVELRLLQLSEEAALVEQDRSARPASFTAVIDDAEERMLSGNHLKGVSSGLASVDYRLGGFAPGELIIVGARPSMGKAQPLTAKVRTPSGWKRMGDLKIGDQVESVDTAASEVTGVFPQGRRPVFRVTFSDGRSTRACGEHLWTIHYRAWPSPRVVSTDRLQVLLTRKRYRHRLWVDLPSGIVGEDQTLPIDPYVLGALLGDGDLCGRAVLTSASEEVVSAFAERLSPEDEMRSDGKIGYWIKSRTRRSRADGSPLPNATVTGIRALGLDRLKSDAKFIPRLYLDASYHQRLELLQGLLDTDGWCEKFGCVRFSSSSRQLADDVQELARSLGAWCSMTVKSAPSYSHKGEKRIGLPAFVLTVSHPEPSSLFLMTGKASRARSARVRRKMPVLLSITPDGEEEVQCITVSHLSRLYVTDDYVVTHNSMLALSMARRMARIKIGVGFDSMEMSEQQVRIRLLSDECESEGHKIPYSLAIKGKITSAQVAALRRADARLSAAPLCIIDQGNRLGDLPGHVRKARKLCEAKGAPLSVFFVDYLGLVSPGDRYRGQRVQEVTEISAALKALAKREKIAIVALHQLNRANENREDRRPRLSELRESGALEQDADIVLFVHREAYYLERPGYGGDKDDPDHTQKLLDCEHVLELIVAKQRQGPICTVKLWADMSMNAVRDAA